MTNALIGYTELRYTVHDADPFIWRQYYRTILHTGRTKKGVGWAAFKSVVQRKLDILNYAIKLDDLRSPPGNRLEALVGNLKGFHSIRINDQWRIVFR